MRVPFQKKGSNDRRKSALIRWKRELSEATSGIRLLEQERAKLVTKCKSAQRLMQRKLTVRNLKNSRQESLLTFRWKMQIYLLPKKRKSRSHYY